MGTSRAPRSVPCPELLQLLELLNSCLPMKRFFAGLPVTVILLIAPLMPGCANNPQQTENILSAAGFNVVIATTPQQLIHLETLPPYKMMRIQRNGKDRYVYADPPVN